MADLDDEGEATEAVPAISDDLFADMMSGGPTSHPSAPDQPAASSPFASPTVALTQPPPGVAANEGAGKLSGSTMSLSADDLEMFVEEADLGGLAVGAGPSVVDSRSETPLFKGVDSIPTNPVPSAASSVPHMAPGGDPAPAPEPPPPVAPAPEPPPPVAPAPEPPPPVAPAPGPPPPVAPAPGPPPPVAPAPAPPPPVAPAPAPPPTAPVPPAEAAPGTMPLEPQAPPPTMPVEPSAPPPGLVGEAPRFAQPDGLHFSEQSTSPSVIGMTQRRSLAKEIVIGVVVAIAILGGGLSAWWFLSGDDIDVPAPEPGRSVLLVETTPAEGVEVYVDDNLVGTGGQVVTAGLEPGPRKVRVRAPGHQTYEVVLELPEGEVAQHAVELVPGSDPVGKVRLSVKPKATRLKVGVDGGKAKSYRPAGHRAWSELSAGEPHTLRVTRPGYQAQVMKITLDPDERRDIDVRLEELFGTIRIASSPGRAKVKLNGKKKGKTPAKIDGLPADRTYLLEVEKRGFEPWSTSVRFDAAHPVFDRKIDLLPKGAAAKQKKAAGNLGYVTVSAGLDVYAKVLVDGEDTGRTTPITSASPLTLAPGSHTITLVLGDKKKDAQVTVIGGKEARIRVRIR